MRKIISVLFFCVLTVFSYAQRPVPVGGGSYASFAPLSASRTNAHEGCQAYQMEHRRLYLPDSLLARLGRADGSQQGTLALPTNDWWTYALVNEWTGKIWMYPAWVEATPDGIHIGYPDHWEETGCEMKWDTPLHIALKSAHSPKPQFECLVDGWSDFSVSFIVRTGDDWVRTTCVHGSPLIWLEAQGIDMTVTNPDPDKFWVTAMNAQGKSWLVVGLKTPGLTDDKFAAYAARVPRRTTMTYHYDASSSSLSTTFSVVSEGITSGSAAKSPCLLAFLPHHYFSAENAPALAAYNTQLSDITYACPRGTMWLGEGNDFTFTYPVHPFLPYFPAPFAWKEGFSLSRMTELTADYAKRGSFGGDTYWGGKGLTQMAHYMTFALQMGDTATFRLAKQRLKQVLTDWYTYTPGEQLFYFARYPRWGALIGFATSYDSDTFNDHHFHYGYFVYASAILCLLDDDFRMQFGDMVREVARDYANWQRSPDLPWFRTLDPYCGHSFAGGLGNAGNGNGQESTSEAIQGWGGLWMLGAALNDPDMLEAGIMGYTLETRATSEYWFDRKRRNIDFTKYKHPYCCNLTMQGVGWWTWFSGDPVWMHSIQWLPISPVLTNCLGEDLPFARWDYTQMYAKKEVGNYDAATGGLGDESGLGNVCLSYLSLFDADSAARVWDKMDKMGKPLAKNPDTGGITYWLTHAHRSLGEKCFDIYADHPLASAYLDTVAGVMTYAVYNTAETPVKVHFFGEKDTTVNAPQGLTLFAGKQSKTVTTITDEPAQTDTDPLAWNLPYPNLALHKSVTATSVENAGCLAANLTDGDLSSRWGSAHRDNESVTVDLGQKCYINNLVLRWEAAYASAYELAFSDDNSSWSAVTLSSAGGVETIMIAGCGLATARTRYIRITGLERATQYGTSLYELEAYGRPLAGDPNSVFVIELAASDTVLYQGQSTHLTTNAYNVNGDKMTVHPVYTVTDGTAFLNADKLTCPDYGSVTVTASADGCESSLTFVVLETEHAAAAVVVPADVVVPLGDTQVFHVSPVNQFGEPLDTCTCSYLATQTGSYEQTYDCGGQTVTAKITVLPYSQVNLARNKPTEMSGSENGGTAADKAVDGDLETRWSSRFMDNEWMAVDLGDCYRLTTVKLFWENAYATDYDIELSDDGTNYRLAKSVTNAKGGVQTLDIRDNGEPVEAQWVRVLCKSRNTGYGSSLWEVEVYGQARCNTSTPTENVKQDNCQNSKFIHNGRFYISHNGVVFNACGAVVMHTEK